MVAQAYKITQIHPVQTQLTNQSILDLLRPWQEAVMVVNKFCCQFKAFFSRTVWSRLGANEQPSEIRNMLLFLSQITAENASTIHNMQKTMEEILYCLRCAGVFNYIFQACKTALTGLIPSKVIKKRLEHKNNWSLATKHSCVPKERGNFLPSQYCLEKYVLFHLG